MAVAAWGIGIVSSHQTSDRLGDSPVNDLRSLLAGLTAVGFLSMGLQLTLIGWLGRFAGARHISSPSFRRTFALAAVALGCAAGTVAALLIESGLRYRIEVGIQVAICVAAAIASVPPRAELLNGERWLRIGILMVVAPATRVIVGAALLSSDRTSWNFLPVTIGEVIGAGTAFALRPAGEARAPAAPSQQFITKGITASTGLFVALALSSLAFRSRLGDDADLFNASAVSARAVIFAPLAIAYFYFPRIARNPIGSAELRRSYSSALLWTAAASGLACAAVLVAPDRLSDAITASGSELSVSVIRILAVSWALTSLSIVSLLQHIAHGSRLSWTPWGGALVMALGQTVSTSGMQLAWFTLAASLAMLVMVCVPAVLRVQPVLHASTVSASSRSTSPRGDITVVVPSFNPGDAVVNTLREIDDEIATLGMSCSIVVVSDGSTDGSADLIDRLSLPSVVHLRHPENRGKGAALRTGFAHAHTEFIAFIDADGDLSPHLLVELLRAQQASGADIVFGSKVHPHSVVKASALRAVYSTGYQVLIRALFQLDIKDTQTGVKLFRHQVIDAIAPLLREDAFALDLELFIAARAAGFTRFVEVPVELRRERGTTISLGSVRRMFTDTMRLFWRAKVTLEYFRSTARGFGLPDLVVGPAPSDA